MVSLEIAAAAVMPWLPRFVQLLYFIKKNHGIDLVDLLKELEIGGVHEKRGGDRVIHMPTSQDTKHLGPCAVLKKIHLKEISLAMAAMAATVPLVPQEKPKTYLLHNIGGDHTRILGGRAVGRASALILAHFVFQVVLLELHKVVCRPRVGVLGLNDLLHLWHLDVLPFLLPYNCTGSIFNE
jgi:hypothetical protein